MDVETSATAPTLRPAGYAFGPTARRNRCATLGATMPARALPFKLHTSKTKTILLLLLALAFATMSSFLALREGSLVGWMGCALFGLGVLVFAINLLPGASYLLVTEEGIEVASLFRRKRHKWSDFAGFGTYSLYQKGIPIRTCVGIRFRDELKGASQFARSVARAASDGFDGALPDSYGMKPKDLAVLLNEVLAQRVSARALASAAHS
jgi:hypothetical protein